MESYVLVDNGRLTEKEARLNICRKDCLREERDGKSKRKPG